MRAPNLVLLLAVAAMAACGGSPEPEQPAPQPTAPVATNDDAARRAADEEARRRAAAEEEARRAEAARAAAAGLMGELTAVINFDYNEASVRAGDQAKLDRKAAIMQANPNLRIRVSGHADDRGSDEYNLALGNQRAAAAKRYLENKGIAAARIDVISFGEERPAAQGSDEASWAQNRRDEFEVVSGGDNLAVPQ